LQWFDNSVAGQEGLDAKLVSENRTQMTQMQATRIKNLRLKIRFIIVQISHKFIFMHLYQL